MPWFNRLSFETYGTLNAAGDNCVLVPTYYAGTDKSYLPIIGPGRALDPARWFIVIPNMLGNGVSTSPSNGSFYAQASIEDNVRLQHALLSALGVKRIALAYGWSMGAMQSFAWAALHPDMVAALLPVCGSASCWPLNYVFLEGVKATMPAGKRAFGRAYAGWAYSAQFYREELYRNIGYNTLEEFLTYWEDDHDGYDERDLLAMLHTWQHARLTEAQLGGIKARTIIMPCAQDMYFTLEEALMEAALMPGAELRVIDSPYGHCAGAPGLAPAESAQIEAAMAELLAS
jgi:homoserine O-acetyltransferase